MDSIFLRASVSRHNSFPYQEDNNETPPLDIPGANFSKKPGNNKTPPRSGGNFFGNNKTPPRSGGNFLNNKTPPRSGGEILSFFKAKTVKFCNKHTDLWTTINPRRRRGKFLKTTKTRREAAKIFWKQQDPGQKIRPKIPYGGGKGLELVSVYSRWTKKCRQFKFVHF